MWVWINTYENTIFRGLFTSILTQLFWCSPGVQGFDTLPWPRWSQVVSIPPLLAGSSKGRSLKCWALAAWPLGPRSWYRDFTWFKHEKTGEVTGIWMRYHGKYMKYIHMCIYESYIYMTSYIQCSCDTHQVLWFQICVIPKSQTMVFIVGEWDDTWGSLQLVVTSPWLKTAPPNRHPTGD